MEEFKIFVKLIFSKDKPIYRNMLVLQVTSTDSIQKIKNQIFYLSGIQVEE